MDDQLKYGIGAFIVIMIIIHLMIYNKEGECGYSDDTVPRGSGCEIKCEGDACARISAGPPLSRSAVPVHIRSAGWNFGTGDFYGVMNIGHYQRKQWGRGMNVSFLDDNCGVIMQLHVDTYGYEKSSEELVGLLKKFTPQARIVCIVVLDEASQKLDAGARGVIREMYGSEEIINLGMRQPFILLFDVKQNKLLYEKIGASTKTVEMKGEIDLS